MKTAQPAATTARLITGVELLAMGDIGPCERIDGAIVRAGPTGGVRRLLKSKPNRRLGMFVDDANSGWRLVGEFGVYIRRVPDRIRGADPDEETILVYLSASQRAALRSGGTLTGFTLSMSKLFAF